MNAGAKEAIELVSHAFAGAKGPANFRYPESGWWFEWEGKRIADSLLDLDPRDFEYDELFAWGSFLPSYSTVEGLMWLLPGIIRVCFEVVPKRGDYLLQELFKDLHDRKKRGELTLTRAQKHALLETHEIFYCVEEFGWEPELYAYPLYEVCCRIPPRTKTIPNRALQRARQEPT